MKQQSKDPFEVAFEEQEEESPPESPIAPDENETQTPVPPISDPVDDIGENNRPSLNPSTSTGGGGGIPVGTSGPLGKSKEDEEEEEEENMEIELGKLTTTGDPDKMAKMQAILSQFTEEQMNRYESFRRSGFQKSNMKRNARKILQINDFETRSMYIYNCRRHPHFHFVNKYHWKLKNFYTYDNCGIWHSKNVCRGACGNRFSRIVMTERKERGPIRPCHIREAYRRLKLEGKVPRRSVPRLFR